MQPGETAGGAPARAIGAGRRKSAYLPSPMQWYGSRRFLATPAARSTPAMAAMTWAEAGRAMTGRMMQARGADSGAAVRARHAQRDMEEARHAKSSVELARESHKPQPSTSSRGLPHKRAVEQSGPRRCR